jgi:hypothetical protein
MAATVTIPAAGSLSGAIDLQTQRLEAIIGDPTAWTAAAISFLGSLDGVTYQQIYNSAGAVISCSITNGIAVGFGVDLANQLNAWQFLKIQSGTVGAPTVQAADRVLTLVTGGIGL